MGERTGESEMEELAPEYEVDKEKRGADSGDKVKHNERRTDRQTDRYADRKSCHPGWRRSN